MKTLIRPHEVTLIDAAYAKCKIQIAYAAYAKIQNTNDFFKEKVRKYSVLVGYEELLRPRFVLSQTSALIIPHILLDLIQ